MEILGFNDISTFLTYGLPGAALVFGLFMYPTKKKSWEDIFFEKIKNAIPQNKSLFGQNRQLSNENSSLRSVLKRAIAQERKNQLSEEQLKGKLVRLKRKLRSTELELENERRRKGGR